MQMSILFMFRVQDPKWFNKISSRKCYEHPSHALSKQAILGLLISQGFRVRIFLAYLSDSGLEFSFVWYCFGICLLFVAICLAFFLPSFWAFV